MKTFKEVEKEINTLEQVVSMVAEKIQDDEKLIKTLKDKIESLKWVLKSED
jgi:hypothetical protein